MFTKRVIFSLLIIHCSIIIANAQWVDSYSGTMAVFHKCKMVNNTTAYICGDSGIVMKTTNLGGSWVRFNTGTNIRISAMDFINESTGFIGDNYGRFFKTTNGGLNWSNIANVSETINDIFFLNANTGMYGSDFPGIGKTTNAGITWTDVCCAEEGPISVYGLTLLDSNNAYAVGDKGNLISTAIYKTTNCGLNWINQYNYDGLHLNSVSFTNIDTGFAVGFFDLYTTNGGTLWGLIPIDAGGLNSIHYLSPKVITACGSDNVIIRSTNGGNNWSQQYYLMYGELNSISFIGLDTGIAVGTFGKILITTQGRVIGIQKISSQIPEDYKLYQNYPNPFNPNTKIKFDIPENIKSQNSNVKLEIYDVLGRELETLIDKQLKPGSYEADWPVEYGQNKYPSGIYFYSLQTENFRETKKMILLK